MNIPCTCGVDLFDHVVPVITDELHSVRVIKDNLSRVEDGVLVSVKKHPVRPVLQHLLPFTQVQEAVVDGDIG